MSWYHDPWTSNEVLDGLPYVVPPAAEYNMDGVYTVWNWDDYLDGLPYIVKAPSFGINNTYYHENKPPSYYYGNNKVEKIYFNEGLIYSID